MAFFRNSLPASGQIGVNHACGVTRLRNRLCGEQESASAPFLDFLKLAENCTFLDRKLCHEVQCRSRPGNRSDRGAEGVEISDNLAANRRVTIVATDEIIQAFGSACVYKRIAKGSQTAVGYPNKLDPRGLYK